MAAMEGLGILVQKTYLMLGQTSAKISTTGVQKVGNMKIIFMEFVILFLKKYFVIFFNNAPYSVHFKFPDWYASCAATNTQG